MARYSQPQLQKPMVFSKAGRQKSPEQFMKEQEDLLKRNRGGFSTPVSDTDADTGFIVPGAMYSKTLATEPEIREFTPQEVTPPAYQVAPEFERYQPQKYSDEQEYSDKQFAVDQPVQANPIYEGTGVLNFFTNFPQAYSFDASYDSLIGECAWFSQQITSLDGNSWRVGNTIQDKVNAFQSYLSKGQAIEPGYGAANVGNSIIFDVGTKWGHVATISEVFQGADGQYYYRLTESNYAAPKTVTHDRVVAYNDPSIVGILNTQARQPYTVVDPGEAPLVQGTRTLAVADNSANGEQERFFNDTDIDLQFQGAEPEPVPEVTEPSVDEPITEPEPTTSGSLMDALTAARQAGSSLLDSIPDTFTEARDKIGEGISTGLESTAQNLGLEAELGLSEPFIGEDSATARIKALATQPKKYNPYRMLAGNTLEAVGDFFNTPEGALSEAVAGGPTHKSSEDLTNQIGNYEGIDRTQVPGIGQNLADIGRDVIGKTTKPFKPPIALAAELPNLPQKASNFIEEKNPTPRVDLGVSEGLRGDWQGAKKVLTDTVGRGINKLGEMGTNLVDLAQPQNLFNRVAGKSGGGNQLASPTASQVGSRESMDTTDPFFKSDIFQRLKGFTSLPNQEAGKDQALSMDVFTDQFYDDPGRVGEVFQSTFMSDPALSKATQRVIDSFRNKYSGSGYDQNDVERIISQLPATLNYSPNLPTPKKVEKIKPTLSDYLRSGRTKAQYYAETGQQSVLDAMNKKPNERSSSKSSGSKLKISNNSSQQYITRPDSGGNLQLIRNEDITLPKTKGKTDLSTPIKSSSAQLKPSSSGSPGVFNRAKEFVGGLFKRFFN